MSCGQVAYIYSQLKPEFMADLTEQKNGVRRVHGCRVLFTVKRMACVDRRNRKFRPEEDSKEKLQGKKWRKWSSSREYSTDNVADEKRPVKNRSGSDVEEWAANCFPCQKQHKLVKMGAELHPVPIPKTAGFEAVGDGSRGPFEKITSRGNRWGSQLGQRFATVPSELQKYRANQCRPNTVLSSSGSCSASVASCRVKSTGRWEPIWKEHRASVPVRKHTRKSSAFARNDIAGSSGPHA
ncbi:hypothetical protein BaRGS_00024672 [Batillaria attramentaria]|uniref:Uncharacterized protein n=1 Tax=Batillaria attramentaria TaxID=370345 RepID=A0ABD0KAB1_9CAEN